MNRKTIVFYGGGNMASVIISKMVTSDWSGEDIHVIDRNAEKLERFSKQFGVQVHDKPGSWMAQIDSVVLAVKPQQLPDAIASAKEWMDEALIISIAAGVRIEDLRAMLGQNRICRAMPNTPMKIGKGVCGLYATAEADEDHLFIVKVFAACGDLIWCDKEEMLEGVTVVSGSGPAYVFRFIEALENAGIRYGFNEVQARRLAIATVLGSAELARQSDEPPAELRAKVTSKGGTTYEALKVMQERGFMEMMQDAMDACRRRSAELGEAFHENLESKKD